MMSYNQRSKKLQVILNPATKIFGFGYKLGLFKPIKEFGMHN